MLWGESLGLTPESSTPFNPLLNRQDIKPGIESALCHLKLLLQKADIVTDRYEIQGKEADDQAVVDLHSQQSVGLEIFRERFDLLKRRLQRNQKEKSAWTVTRWVVHDLGKFKDVVANIRELMDGLEGITSTLGVLQQQQALLTKEIESISDTQSLRLLQQVACSDGASISLRLASETASIRLSLMDDTIPNGTIRSTETSYYTALSHLRETSIQHSVIMEDMEPKDPPAMETHSAASELAKTDVPIPGTSGHQQQQRNRRLLTRVKQRVEGLPILSPFTRMQTPPLRSAKLFKGLARPVNILKEPSRVAGTPMAMKKTSLALMKYEEPTEPTTVSEMSLGLPTRSVMLEESRTNTIMAHSATEDLEGLPQNQRLMAELVKSSTGRLSSPSFGSGSVGYGDTLASIRLGNDQTHSDHALRLLLHADNDNGMSAARRAFLELRSIRMAAVPFITASLMEDRLDRLIATIEGPPDTPYQGGVFWILVKLPPQTAEPPMLRFITKIYHPNVDCNGKICADYQSWWKDPNLQRYMNRFSAHRRENTPWFSDDSWNPYSLGALLTALCSLLASPNVLDPLVPEIAATYVQNYAGYCENARLYTQRYATQERPADVEFDRFDQEADSFLELRQNPNQAQREAIGSIASSAINLRTSRLSVHSDESTLSVRERQIQKKEEEEEREFLMEIRSDKRTEKEVEVETESSSDDDLEYEPFGFDLDITNHTSPQFWWINPYTIAQPTFRFRRFVE